MVIDQMAASAPAPRFSEIGDAVIAVLDRRIAKMKAELRNLGIEEA
jgi:hypothetical protein